MKLLLLNILLAAAWVALTGQYTAGNLMVGFVLAFLAVWLTQRARSTAVYIAKIGTILSFLTFILWELVLSNLRVAWEVLTPRHGMRPGIVAIPLDLETDLEITVLMQLITLMPGTLGLDVSADRKTLFIHEMFIGSRDQVIRSIKGEYERRVRELLR